MLKWISAILLALIVTAGVLEYTTGRSPLEQVLALAGWARGADSEIGKTVIRLGISGWQMDEFPWDATIRRYEAAHPAVRIRASVLPEDTIKSMLLSWARGQTSFDVILIWADEEIQSFIDYRTRDDEGHSLLINVRRYLSKEQIDSFMPALMAGSSRTEPNGQIRTYELPWMGEVLALNYNRQYFAQRGIAAPPKTWEEVEQVCRKLKGLKHGDKDVSPLALDFSQSFFFGQNTYIPMLAAFKEGRGIKDARGRLDVSSPEAVKVFETLKRWYKAGYITLNAMNNESVEQELRALRTAMYPHWQSRGLMAVKELGPGVIGLAPSPGSEQAGSLVSTYGCIIPKCSPVVRPAVDFCYETFSTDTYGYQTAEANGWTFTDSKGNQVRKGGGKMPATKALYERADLMPGIAEMVPALKKGYSYADPLRWSQVAEILVVEFQKYLTGEHDTAQAALAKVQQRMDQEVYGGK